MTPDEQKAEIQAIAYDVAAFERKVGQFAASIRARLNRIVPTKDRGPKPSPKTREDYFKLFESDPGG